MPVYNEQAVVGQVTYDWLIELKKTAQSFVLLIIDDGSTDSTAQILARLHQQNPDHIEILTRPNRGHGQTCIEGYRIAIERGARFILQIDSDGQSDPVYFNEFWKHRNLFDVIYGKRSRQDGMRRIITSAVLRKCLRLFTQVDCVDANVPYRMMNTSSCAEAIRSVPTDVFLANVALAVILRKNPSIRHGQVPIGFPPRHGGEPSVPFRKFAIKGMELFMQLKKAGIR